MLAIIRNPSVLLLLLLPQVLARSGDFLMDLSAAALMLAATIILTAFCLRAAPAVAPQQTFQVYDGITTSKAHIFMPAKAAHSPAAVADGLAAAAAASNSSTAEAAAAVLDGNKQPTAPGNAGRWLLPDDSAAGWEAWAGLMAAVHRMTQLWAAYTLLQGLVLVLLIIKWVECCRLTLILNPLILR